MAPKVKNEHYVPVSYLKNFTSEKEQINVFDKFTGRRFRTNVTNVASEMYFYDTRDELESEHQTQSVEHDLSSFESHSKLVLAQFIESLEKGVFLEALRPGIAQIMAVMYLRTKEYRESIKEVVEKVGSSLMRESAREVFPEKPEDEIRQLGLSVDQQYLADMHLEYALNDEVINQIAEIFRAHIWRVGINRSVKSLYTSDQPVARVPHVRNGIEALVGPASPGVEIHFPLNSTFEIILFEREFHKKLEQHENSILDLGLEHVQYSNQLQFIASYRFVFSEDSNFSLVRMLRELQPEQCIPDKERIRLRNES